MYFSLQADREKLAALIEDTLRNCFSKKLLSPLESPNSPNYNSLGPQLMSNANQVTVNSGS